MDYSVYIKRTADFELGTLELSNIADNMKGVICSGMPQCATADILLCKHWEIWTLQMGKHATREGKISLKSPFK